MGMNLSKERVTDLTNVPFADQLNSLQCKIGNYFVNLRETLRDEGRVTTGGHDVGIALELPANALEDFANHAAIPIDRSGPHCFSS